MTFQEIKDEVIKSDKYQLLDLEYHHGLTRYKHIMHVAKITYFVCKIIHIDYKSATKGALLHDYFLESEYLNIKGLNKPRIHPFLALNNSLMEHNLNIKEKNIIISHMYPIGLIKPMFIESWIVTIVDKLVASYEYINYKYKDKFALYLIFFFNFLNIKL